MCSADASAQPSPALARGARPCSLPGAVGTVLQTAQRWADARVPALPLKLPLSSPLSSSTPPNGTTMTANASIPEATHADSPSLGAHLRDCRRAQGCGFGLQCVGERVDGVLGPRLVTTVFAAATLIALLGCA